MPSPNRQDFPIPKIHNMHHLYPFFLQDFLSIDGLKQHIMRVLWKFKPEQIDGLVPVFNYVHEGGFAQLALKVLPHVRSEEFAFSHLSLGVNPVSKALEVNVFHRSRTNTGRNESVGLTVALVRETDPADSACFYYFTGDRFFIFNFEFPTWTFLLTGKGRLERRSPRLLLFYTLVELDLGVL